MSDYATVSDLRRLGGHLLCELLPGGWGDKELEGLLSRAESDVRAWLRLRDEDPPGWVEHHGASWQDPLSVAALRIATCEQCLYRLSVGEDSIAEGWPTLSAAGGVTFAQRHPELVGPEAKRSLAAVPLLHVNRHGLGIPPDLPEDDDAA